MPEPPADPRWPRLLSLSAHEIRNPVGVISGYVRMLLNESFGPVNDQQRRLLHTVEASYTRLSRLAAEMSDLANLESGVEAFNRTTVDLRTILNDAITGLPEQPDRTVAVELSTNGSQATLEGDAVRLKTAFVSLLMALRRELTRSDKLFVHERRRRHDGSTVSWIAFGDSQQVERLADADPSSLETFDEWRGGCGLSLAVARRVISAHNGRIWSAGEGSKAAAVVMLPVRS